MTTGLYQMRQEMLARLLDEGTEFVTTDEFVALSEQVGFVRESPIQGRIRRMTYISLVPPGAV